MSLPLQHELVAHRSPSKPEPGEDLATAGADRKSEDSPEVELPHPVDRFNAERMPNPTLLEVLPDGEVVQVDVALIDITQHHEPDEPAVPRRRHYEPGRPHRVVRPTVVRKGRCTQLLDALRPRS